MPQPSNKLVRWYWNLFAEWNHCSLQFDDTVMHPFDSSKPRWIPVKLEKKLFEYTSNPISFYMGETNVSMGEIVYTVNQMPVFNKFDQFFRYVNSLTGLKFKMPNSCVHKSTTILNMLFDYPILFGIPDHIIKEYKLDIKNAIR